MAATDKLREDYLTAVEAANAICTSKGAVDHLVVKFRKALEENKNKLPSQYQEFLEKEINTPGKLQTAFRALFVHGRSTVLKMPDGTPEKDVLAALYAKDPDAMDLSEAERDVERDDDSVEEVGSTTKAATTSSKPPPQTPNKGVKEEPSGDVSKARFHANAHALPNLQGRRRTSVVNLIPIVGTVVGVGILAWGFTTGLV